MTKNVNKFITIEDDLRSNDLYAEYFEDSVYISVFEFDCKMNLEKAAKLRDYLNAVLNESMKKVN